MAAFFVFSLEYAHAKKCIVYVDGWRFRFRFLGRQYHPPQKIDKNQGVKIDDVVVKASVVKPQKFNGSVEHISREEIERIPVNHAAEILQDSPSVNTITSFTRPTIAMNIRGVQDFGRVNMSIDGMRQNFVRMGHSERSGEMVIDPNLLAGVDIVKGPGSGLGGAGTVGGQANFRTLNATDILLPNRKIGGLLNATTGISRWSGGKKIDGKIGVAARPTENTDLMLVYSRNISDDYRIGGKGDFYWHSLTNTAGTPGIMAHTIYCQDPATGKYDGSTHTFPVGHIMHTPEKMKGSGRNNYSYLIKAGWQINSSHRLQFSYLYSTVDANKWGAEIYTSCHPPTYDWRFRHEGESKLTNRSFAIDYAYTSEDERNNVTAKLYHTKTSDHEDIYSYVSSRTDPRIRKTLDHSSTLALTTIGLNVDSHFKRQVWGSNSDFNLGLELFRDKSDSKFTDPDFAGTTPDNAQRYFGGIHSNADFDWGKFRFGAGLRYDWYSLKGQTQLDSIWLKNPPQSLNDIVPNIIDVKRSKGGFSPSARISYLPTKNIEIYGKIGSAWRAPAIPETLMTAPGHNTLPNPWLKPERALSKEIGINTDFRSLFKEEDRLNIHLGYFHNDIDDFIAIRGLYYLPPGRSYVLPKGVHVNHAGKTKLKGWEFDINYDADTWYAGFTASDLKYKQLSNPIMPNSDFKISYLFYGYEFKGGWLMKMPFPSQRRYKLNMGFRAFDRKLNVGFNWRYVGNPHNRDDQNSPLSPSQKFRNKYHLFDIYASYKPIDNLTIRFAIKNLGDKAYSLPMASINDGHKYGQEVQPGPGLAVTLGLNYRF